MKIEKMSKGMQRQAALILGLATKPKYILFDEIFDGLDPVIREILKKILVDYVTENGSTIIIASHNLRELEDLCDHVGLLHEGGVVLEAELDEAKLGLTRLSAAFASDDEYQATKEKLNVIKERRTGKMIEWTVRNDAETTESVMSAADTLFYETLPLTLEEVFINEMEAVGYEVKNITE